MLPVEPCCLPRLHARQELEVCMIPVPASGSTELLAVSQGMEQTAAD